jgi:hypothetical protein
MNRHPYTTDTSAEAEAVQLQLIRDMSPSERLDKALRLSSQMMRWAKDAIRRRHPEFSTREVTVKFIELHYGAELAAAVREHLEGTPE